MPALMGIEPSILKQYAEMIQRHKATKECQAVCYIPSGDTSNNNGACRFNRRTLSRVAGPIFMSMAYSDHENGSILFDAVDNQMGFERMDPNRRRKIFSLTSQSGICGDQFKYREQVVMVPPSL